MTTAALIAAGVTAASSAAGAVASSKSKQGPSQTVQQSSSSQPLDWQQNKLEWLFREAGDNYLRDGSWDGPTTVGLNDQQRQALARLSSYANGQGADLATQTGNTAGILQGGGMEGVNTARTLASGGTGGIDPTTRGVLTSAASGQPLTGPTAAGTTGLAGQTGALSTAQNLAAGAQGDPNAAIVAGANQYVDPTRVQGTVDAALRDVSRNLNENVLPGLNARAMAGGTVNSSRAGAAEAVARRGAEDRAADIASQIREQAFQTGVGASLQAKGQQDALALGANAQAGSIAGALSGLGETQRQFDTNTRVGAAQDLGALDLSNRGLDAQTRLGASGQLISGANAGVTAAGAAGALSDANAGRIAAGGDAEQAEAQRQLDEQVRQHFNRNQYTWDQLYKAYGIIGDKNWGGTGTEVKTGTTTNPSNAMGGALGGLALGAGLVGGGNGRGILSMIPQGGSVKPPPAGVLSLAA